MQVTDSLYIEDNDNIVNVVIDTEDDVRPFEVGIPSGWYTERSLKDIIKFINRAIKINKTRVLPD